MDLFKKTMFGFIKKTFIGLLSVCTVVHFSGSLQSNYKESIKCVTLNDRLCQAIPTLASIISDEILFYPFTVSVNECVGSCSTIDDPYAQVCLPNEVKHRNVKVFNLMSKINETRSLVQHESFKCKCGLNESVCNSRQKWNLDECCCECDCEFNKVY